jgi:hypothetical protein
MFAYAVELLLAAMYGRRLMSASTVVCARWSNAANCKRHAGLL